MDRWTKLSQMVVDSPMLASPALLLSRSLISRLATPKDYVAAVRSGFVDMAEGRTKMASVGHVPGMDGAFHIKAAGRVGAQALAVVKVNGNFPLNSARYQLPTIQGFIALLDAERGCVLALMDTVEITARRTAAATALAAEYLAVPKAHNVGIIGCGMQARYHVDALLEVVPVSSIRFMDPNDDAARTFEMFLRDKGVGAKRVHDARTACEDAQIVVTLTPSTRPVLGLADVLPGTFVAGVGADNPSKHELASDLLCASRVVADSIVQASEMGDLHHALASGRMTASAIHGELADLIVHKVRGRENDAERWIFDSTGLAIQDLAAATMVYERASAVTDIPRMRFND
jgi:ornithine cyclodeaminase/alanine dehydrogenase-like protein (mu-crystallin family)